MIAIILLGIGAAIGAAGKSTNTATKTVTVPGTPGPTVTETNTVTTTASPAPPSNGQTLISKTGLNQNWNSKPFDIGNTSVTVSYSYSSCPDGQGNFIADLITAGVSQSDTSYEDINIANAIGSGGSDKTNEYQQNPGSKYYLSVQTECTFNIKVISG